MSRVRRKPARRTLRTSDLEGAQQRLADCYGLREFHLGAAARLVGPLSVVNRLRVMPGTAAGVLDFWPAAAQPVKTPKEPARNRSLVATMNSDTRSAA